MFLLPTLPLSVSLSDFSTHSFPSPSLYLVNTSSFSLLMTFFSSISLSSQHIFTSHSFPFLLSLSIFSTHSFPSPSLYLVTPSQFHLLIIFFSFLSLSSQHVCIPCLPFFPLTLSNAVLSSFSFPLFD